jgi:Ca2+-binding EF-hand superfamily protein
MRGRGVVELNEFLERKLVRRFQTFDFDGNGQIERSDFEVSAGRVADEFGHSADSPARQRLLGLSLQLWDHLVSVADADRDGTISLDEYKKAFADGLLETEASFEQGYRPFLDALMAVIDTDGNGMLDVDEYVGWTGALMHLPEADAREVHRRLDTDGDGFVTTQELLQAIHDFYFDDDPNGVGSWLLGRLPD